MSDGPYKSLPMSRAWKKVAEYCEPDAFTAEDVRDALVVAIEKECRSNLSPEFLDRLRDVGATLFPSTVLADLDFVRSRTGASLESLVLEHVNQATGVTGSGPEFVRNALANAIIDRTVRVARQIEEHYLRKSKIILGRKVRSTIENAIGRSINYCRALASQLLGSHAAPKVKLRKHTGIDDGVSLL